MSTDSEDDWSDENCFRSKRQKRDLDPWRSTERNVASFVNEVTQAVRRISQSHDPLAYDGTIFRATAAVLTDDIRTECNRLTSALEETAEAKARREAWEKFVRLHRGGTLNETSGVKTADAGHTTNAIALLRAQVRFASQVQPGMNSSAFNINFRVKPISWFQGRVPAAWLAGTSWRREHWAELSDLTEMKTKCSDAAEALKSVPALVHEGLDADEVRMLESVSRKIEAANTRASSAVETVTRTTLAKRSLKDLERRHSCGTRGVGGNDFGMWMMSKLEAAGVSLPDWEFFPDAKHASVSREFRFLLDWAWHDDWSCFGDC